MLYATVRQRKVYVKLPATIVRNGVGVDWLTLDMDDEWKEMTSILCVFTLRCAAKEVKKEMLHTFGARLLVPWECLTETGTLELSCTGYVGSEKIMRTAKADSYWNIVQEGYDSGDAPMEPTPTLYEQVLAAAGAATSAASEANQTRRELENARVSGEFDGEDGVTPALTIGTVQTGAPGTEAAATLTGTAENPVLNLVLPRGDRGKEGERGKDGKDGVPPPVSEADEGKVLQVVDGAWAAAELPRYDGAYSVTPSLEGTTLQTARKLMDADVKIEKIPYAEVTNQANGTTVTIG